MNNQELVIPKNKYDRTGECLQSGLGAEELFDQIAISKHLEIKNARRRENMQKHIDKYVTDDVGTWSVDIKARKKTRRSDDNAQDDWIWIEFQNVRGNTGWLYGEADCIAFETQDNFVIVEKDSLIKYVENVVDMGKSVKYSSQARYRTYRRANRNDLLTMVELSEIKKNCDHFIWEK